MSLPQLLLAKFIGKQAKKYQVKVLEDIKANGKPQTKEEVAAMAERVTGKKVDPDKLDAIMSFILKGKNR